ncbi:MAG: MATE family efflux transporter [Acidobacteria bacterium]|nr:MAG: MATE family efflux transporter [Acidobacteriota bacterium]
MANPSAVVSKGAGAEAHAGARAANAAMTALTRTLHALPRPAPGRAPGSAPERPPRSPGRPLSCATARRRDAMGFERAALGEEIRAMVRLAAPVVAVQLGLVAMGVVDTMMLGRYSAAALAAGGLGNSIGFGLLVFPMGLLMAVDPLIAQAYGAGDRSALSRRFRRALALAAVLAVPVSLAMWDARPLLRRLGQDPAVIAGCSDYLRALIPGNAAFLWFVVVRQSLQATGRVRPALTAVLSGNAVNVLANWVLIFGRLGFPALGVTGSAAATALSRWVSLVVLIADARRPLAAFWDRTPAWLRRWSSYRTILAVGIPIGIHVTLEVWMFTGATLIVGMVGPIALAGHQIALNMAALTFMVPWGISGAAAARVGQAIGRGDMAAARRAAAVAMGLGTAVMTVSAAAFLSFPLGLARAYTPDAEVIRVAVGLLPIAGLFQVADGLQAVAGGVLRGAADTRIPAVLALLGYWLVGLPAGYYLTFPAGMGARGMWVGLSLGLGSAAILLTLRVIARMRGTIAPVTDPA